MKYPSILVPDSFENFIVNEKIVQIPKCRIELNNWKGIPLNFTFGGKAVVDFENSPMFAELAIMNMFKNDGWNSRWIETYGKPKLKPIFLTGWIDENYKSQINNPVDSTKVEGLLNLIAQNNKNNFSGCWDVIAWKNDDIIFAESKRMKKDSIRTTQNKWLESSLISGFTEENFLLVEWNSK